MKKITILLVMFAFLASFAVAQNIGLEVGAELGMDNITEGNDKDSTFIAAPTLIYANTFDALDVWARLRFRLWFVEDNFTMTPYLELNAGYSIPLGPGTLRIGLWDELLITIPEEGDNVTWGYIEPTVRYSYTADFGTIHAQPSVGIEHLTDFDSQIDVNFQVGYFNPIGFGINAKMYLNVSNGVEEMKEIRFLPYYVNGPIYAEVDVRIGNPGSGLGDSYIICPYFSYQITSQLRAWAWVWITGAEADDDVQMWPTIGAAWKF